MVKSLTLRPKSGTQSGSQEDPVDVEVCAFKTEHQQFTLLTSSLTFRQRKGI